MLIPIFLYLWDNLICRWGMRYHNRGPFVKYFKRLRAILCSLFLCKNMVAQDLTDASFLWYNYYNGGVLLKKIKNPVRCAHVQLLFIWYRSSTQLLPNKCSVGRPPAPRNVLIGGRSSSSSF